MIFHNAGFYLLNPALDAAALSGIRDYFKEYIVTIMNKKKQNQGLLNYMLVDV